MADDFSNNVSLNSFPYNLNTKITLGGHFLIKLITTVLLATSKRLHASRC